jgi:deazaflavin-dependent oxidoreductase (nitroreductase family)
VTNEREDRAARNAAVIEEFRANGGVVGGRSTTLLLHTKGARTGEPRLNPVAFQEVDGGWAIFATRAGAPRHPDWYQNLVANPDVTIEVGTETLDVRARTAEGEERERIWTKQKEAAPNFAEYEAKTDRVIPVVILERR